MINIAILSVAHKSGSTMLQRLFNARKETLIWGEHYGVLRRFCDIQEDVIKAGEGNSGRKNKQIFFNDNNNKNPNVYIPTMCPDDEYIHSATIFSVRSFLDNLYTEKIQGHDMIGFKEVWYTPREIKLLKECYPNLKFIFLVRNPIDIWNSHSPQDRINWYPNQLSFEKKWNVNVEYFLNEVKSNDNAHLFRYEDIINKNPETIDKLSEVARITQKQIDNVLGVKLGSTRNQAPDKDKQEILQRCRSNMNKLGY